MKFYLRERIKEIFYVFLFAIFVMLLQYFSAKSRAFWYIELFLLTTGNILFSSELETILNYIKASFSFQLSLKSRENKFKKLEKKSKIRRSRTDVKVKRAFNYIMFNVFIVATSLVHGLFASANKYLGFMLLSTGIILLLLSILPLFLPWLFLKLIISLSSIFNKYYFRSLFFISKKVTYPQCTHYLHNRHNIFYTFNISLA